MYYEIVGQLLLTGPAFFVIVPPNIIFLVVVHVYYGNFDYFFLKCKINFTFGCISWNFNLQLLQAKYLLYKMHAIISANHSMQAQKGLHTLQKFNTKQLGDLFQKQKIKRSLWNLCAVYAGLKIRRSKQHITRVIQTTTHSSSVQTGTSKALGGQCSPQGG